MKVEWLEDVDIEAANAFHNRAYGTSRTVAQWRWEFDRPIGAVRPFAVVKEDGRIVGTQALMPITLLTPSGTILTAKSEETLVDASMRGKGVFPAMYRPLLELAKANGVHAIWGFTPAVKPFESAGFHVPARTSQLVYPLSTRATEAFGEAASVTGWKRAALTVGVAAATVVSAARTAVPQRTDRGLELRVLDQPPLGAGELCREFIRTWGGVTILRDSAYLEWRYFANPFVRATMVGAFRGDELVGWAAFSLDASAMGYLVDALVPRRPDAPEVLGALIRFSVRTLRAAGAVAVRSWHVNNHPFDTLLLRVARSLGFFHVRRGEPAVLRFEESLPPDPAILSWDNWYVSRAYTQGESG